MNNVIMQLSTPTRGSEAETMLTLSCVHKLLIYADYLPANGVVTVFAVQIVRPGTFCQRRPPDQSRFDGALVAFCANICSGAALANMRLRFQSNHKLTLWI